MEVFQRESREVVRERTTHLNVRRASWPLQTEPEEREVQHQVQRMQWQQTSLVQLDERSLSGRRPFERAKRAGRARERRRAAREMMAGRCRPRGLPENGGQCKREYEGTLQTTGRSMARQRGEEGGRARRKNWMQQGARRRREREYSVKVEPAREASNVQVQGRRWNCEG